MKRQRSKATWQFKAPLLTELLSEKGSRMFTAQQYRAKAGEYANLVQMANSANEMREFQRLARSFAELADNAQWVTENHDKTVAPAQSAAQQ